MSVLEPRDWERVAALLRSDDEIDELLARTRSVAVVGVSGDSERPSRRVTAYLIGATDWTVYLVNPNIDEALGRHVYPSLADLPEPPDIVDTFDTSSICRPWSRTRSRPGRGRSGSSSGSSTTPPWRPPPRPGSTSSRTTV